MNVENTAFPAENLSTDNVNTVPHNETIFDFRDLLRILRTRLRIIIGTAIVVIALTALFLFRIVPVYTATALVMLDQRSNKVVDLNAVLSGLPTDQSSIENQVQILRSRTLLIRVVDKLQLDRDPEFSPSSAAAAPAPFIFTSLDPADWIGAICSLFATTSNVSILTDEQKSEADRNTLIDRLLGQLTVAAQGRSTAIQIRVDFTSPSKAALIANTVADAYVEDQLNSKVEATQTTTKWLADRIQEASVQAQGAETAVQQYKAQHNLTDTGTSAGGGATTIVQQQLSQFNGQLVVSRTELAQEEAKYARMVELQQSGRATDVSEVVASPLISQLRGQESELQGQIAELSNRYGPRHPRILEVESQKLNLDAKIAEEVQRVIETVSSEVTIARARVKSLQDSMAALSKNSDEESRTKVKLSELESMARSSRALYETFLSKFKDTQGQTDIETPEARVISRAQMPKVPAYPNKTRSLELAIAGGLFLGFLLAMLVERLDAGFRTSVQAERLLGLPVLATLPEVSKLGKKEESAADRVIVKPLSAYSEGVRGLQMGLALSNVDETPKVVIVTSSVPNEGKTTVAISLARLAARSGKNVVLVDCDMRRPGVAAMVGEKDLKCGLVHCLTGKEKLEQCLVKDSRSDLMILPSVGKTSSPPDVLSSVAMERLVKFLRESYDLVVIDSPPLLPVNDTKILARLADSVVFVVRWERTPREAVIGAIHGLATAAATIAGIVLTRADDRRHQYYSYGYASYYSYRKYYNE